ncbi:YraN family protein [uncultured Pelagimonas sp.]|uniref:YraN family protein n=1 Tax=uncultured Pelagimonas sp. TaxID=1618102 RepID=UPI0026099A16|nr:YraN family protein [uncultured Pelagimonas sp.]
MIKTVRQSRGSVGFHAGMSAELQVAQDYERRGFAILETRWRGQGGEIDLIAKDGDGLIFIEVKKSRNTARAAERLSPHQMLRLQSAAEEFAGTQPLGLLTSMRFDVALVDNQGVIHVIENAIGH